MSSEIDEFRKSLVAAVQAELERHASAVVAEVDRLRDEGRQERAELRNELTEQVSRLAQALEQVQQRADQRAVESAERVREQLDGRLEEAEARQVRRLDDLSAGLEGMVSEAMRPVTTDLREENEQVVRRVESLDTNLRKFDEQAARMVTYFNDVTQQMEQRQEEAGEAIKTEVTEQVDALKKMVEDNDSTVRRFQSEVSQSVSQKINDAEDRFNNRLLAAESRMKDDAGQKIAEIDAHVGKVSAGLDDTMNVINDRIAKIDDRFVEVGRRIDGVEERVEGVDQEALEELKEKMSSAAGEAMLVRIEMERLEKATSEKSDELAVRVTEVETQLHDATMDVSTAVQLDRLEEIERSLAELDPTQFVLKEGVDDGTSGSAPDGNGTGGENVKNEYGDADEPSGFDPSAILAAEENRKSNDES